MLFNETTDTDLIDLSTCTGRHECGLWQWLVGESAVSALSVSELPRGPAGLLRRLELCKLSHGCSDGGEVSLAMTHPDLKPQNSLKTTPAHCILPGRLVYTMRPINPQHARKNQL